MSGATLDTHARSATGDGTGVWSFDPAAGTFGGFRPDAAGLTADGATGKGVTTAIIDSGIDNTHKDFSGEGCTPGPYTPCNSRIKRTVVLDHLVGDGFDVQGLPTTELASGHGTHVAGIIAGNGFYTRDGDADAARYGGDGRVFGVAPQSELVSIKNGDTIWAGLSSFGLEWLIAHGRENGIRAVNNSWGCIGGCAFDGDSRHRAADPRPLRRGHRSSRSRPATTRAGRTARPSPATRRARTRSASPPTTTRTTSSRTSRAAARRRRPARSPTRRRGRPSPSPSTASAVPTSARPASNIWAARTLTGGAASGTPRVNLNDALGGGSSGFVPYAQMGGTSMATPHVVGAAAVLFGACPSATPLDVMRAVMAGAVRDRVHKTGSATAVAEPFETGYGGLDVRRSLDFLRAQPACA